MILTTFHWHLYLRLYRNVTLILFIPSFILMTLSFDCIMWLTDIFFIASILVPSFHFKSSSRLCLSVCIQSVHALSETFIYVSNLAGFCFRR